MVSIALWFWGCIRLVFTNGLHKFEHMFTSSHSKYPEILFQMKTKIKLKSYSAYSIIINVKTDKSFPSIFHRNYFRRKTKVFYSKFPLLYNSYKSCRNIRTEKALYVTTYLKRYFRNVKTRSR